MRQNMVKGQGKLTLAVQSLEGMEREEFFLFFPFAKTI